MITPPQLGGWTRKLLIELADRRTERRGSKTLDLDSEFLMALQAFCLERRWSWRRKFSIFPMQPGVWQYDLTQPATANPPGANAPDLNQFVKHGVKYYPNSATPQTFSEITPLFERDLQGSAIYTNANYPQPGEPRQYFLMPGAFLVLCVTPVPSAAFPMSIDYWSCPSGIDSLGEQIPLVPAFLHHVLLKRLEAQIFRYTLGEGAAKYQAAMGEYTAYVAQYSQMDAMVPGEHLDYSADDDYESTFANAQNAVQSTR